MAGDLPLRLLELAVAKRREFSNRQAVRDNLSFPEDWLGREAELDDSLPGEPLPAAEPDTEPQSRQSEEVHLNPRSRLSRATFEDVMFSLRHWANAVERYPAAFAVLVEDRISDLLAATWNATLPGAGREVYSRGGKSDIFRPSAAPCACHRSTSAPAACAPPWRPAIVPRPARHPDHLVEDPAFVGLAGLHLLPGVPGCDLGTRPHRQTTSHALTRSPLRGHSYVRHGRRFAGSLREFRRRSDTAGRRPYPFR